MWNRGKRSVGLGLTNRRLLSYGIKDYISKVDLRTNSHFFVGYDVTHLQENFLAAATKPFSAA
jgi:hypothetical protein